MALSPTKHLIVVRAYGYHSGIATNPGNNPAPKNLHDDLLHAISKTKTKYPTSDLLIIGDLQTTINNTPLHNKLHPVPPRDFNLYTLATTLELISVIPAKYPDLTYIPNLENFGSNGPGTLWLPVFAPVYF